MTTVRPFRGLRPSKEYADKVVSLPYDVMNREEAAKMAEGNPCSFLHISRSEIDLPDQPDPYDASVYAKAKENLADFEDKGILVRDEKPSYYIYKEVMDGREQAGIFACASVDEYEAGIVKRHELTLVAKEIDRINHFDACDANTEPVFLTYRDNDELDALIADEMANSEPLYDVTAADGVEHVLWKVDDEAKVEKIRKLFEETDALYIADGHHRTASACKVSKKRREANPGYTGDEESNYVMAAIFPAKSLKIFDYNRVVKDLNGLSKEEFIDAVKKAGFEVTELGKEQKYPEGKNEFTMFLDGMWYKLKATDGIIPKDDPVEALDVSILQKNLLTPILGIGDPRKDPRIDFVGGIRGLGELENRVNKDMKVAFAVYPVDIFDLLDIADKGLIMPPKSTWFEPKLASGLLVHTF